MVEIFFLAVHFLSYRDKKRIQICCKSAAQIYTFKSLSMSYGNYLYYLVEFNSLICDEDNFCRTRPAES